MSCKIGNGNASQRYQVTRTHYMAAQVSLLPPLSLDITSQKMDVNFNVIFKRNPPFWIGAKSHVPTYFRAEHARLSMCSHSLLCMKSTMKRLRIPDTPFQLQTFFLSSLFLGKAKPDTRFSKHLGFIVSCGCTNYDVTVRILLTAFFAARM